MVCCSLINQDKVRVIMQKNLDMMFTVVQGVDKYSAVLCYNSNYYSSQEKGGEKKIDSFRTDTSVHSIE